MPKNRLTLAIFSLVAAVILWLAGITPSQAYTYNNYELDDLTITQTDASPGATNTITLSFTVPDDMSSGLTTSGYVYINFPYLYRYSNNSYTSAYVDVSSATVSSDQLTKSYQGSSYISFTPKTNLSAGSTVTVTITDAINPDGLEGTGSFSVYGSEYNSTAGYYNWFWGSASQAYGDVDLTVTMYRADGTTPVANVSVSASNYDSSSDYEYHYGYAGSNGQVQFAGLTSGRTYWLTFYYSGTATSDDPPVGQQVTFNGTALTQSYSFATANVTTHFKDITGNAINNAYWYFYKTDYTNYYTDYVWRWGYTDSTGLISGAAQVAGSYKLYIYDPSNNNYDSYDFTVNSSGVVSGLVDPIQQTGPEVVGTVTADGTAVSNAYVYIHDSTWSNYKYDYTDSSGNYSFDLTTAATYSLEVSSYGLPSSYFAPAVQTLSVTPGTITTLNLALEAATKTISGTVSKRNDDKITDATIYAYQSSGSYRYVSAQVDSSGNFTLPVTGGTWNVYIYQNQWPATWAYTGSSMMATFANNAVSETATLNIKVKPYNSHFTGRVLKPDGTPVGANDVYIYMYGGENNAVWSYDYTDINGEFDISTTEGSFSAYMYLYANSGLTNLSIPSLGTQTVEDDQTKDLGDITLIEKTAHIQGHITIRDSGDPVANQYVYAYRQDGGWDWASATTDANGFFDLLMVGPAKWTIYTYASGLTTSEGKNIIYSGGGMTVNLTTSDEIVTGQDFFFDVADATAGFTVQDDAGTTLTDQYGWVSLSTNTASDYGWSSVGCYVQRGSCSLPMAADVAYIVNYYPYNWYSNSDETSYSYSHFTVDGVQAETLTLDSNETQEVVLVISENNSSITGSFVNTNGDPVAVTGYVYASGGNNRWVSAYINNSSSYTLKVSAGTWDVSYWIYGDWMSTYKKSKEVVVGDSEEVELDLVAYHASATISGVVLDPTGNPVATPVFVQASTSYGTEHTDTENDTGLISQTTYTEGSTGQFSMKVPEGKYYLTASSPDYLSPQPVKVNADNAGSSQNLTLAFINPGTTIHGKVTAGNIDITVNAQRTEAQGDVISDAFVYVYCVGGSYDSTKSDETGQYAISAPADDTCYVGGIYQTEGAAYYSKQEQVKTNKTSVEKDLVLNQSIDLPEAQTVRFNPHDGTVIELENGVRVEIPANAITADEAVTEVVVVVTPSGEAVHQPGLEPISIVYQLTATDAAGNPIAQFAGDVKIIIPYDEDDLTASGTDEDHIQTNYYEDAANTWQAVDGGVIKNKDENQFEISVQHFSVFGIVASRSIALADETGGGETADDNSEVVEEETVEAGILGIPSKVTVKKRANGIIVVTWKQADNAEQYQVKLSTTKKTVRKVKTEQHRVVLKKLKAKKTYRVQVRSLGYTGSKSGWSTRLKVKLSGGNKTAALLQRAEVFN